jgi:energy-coupling factor transporter ATP-binding protein EcfA2
MLPNDPGSSAKYSSLSLASQVKDPTLQPLTIELGDANSKPYKSIDRILWSDIPPFAVLTGLNGSGKTQLLQVLAYKLSNATDQQYPDLNAIPLKVTGENIGPHEIAYLPSAENAFRIEATNMSNLYQAKQTFLQRLSPQNVEHNIEARILCERVQRKYGIQITHPVSLALAAKLPDDFMYMLEYGEVSAGLSHVFVGYQIRFAEKLLDRQPEEQILQELGRPPWDFVNEALESAEFGYRIVPPENKLMKDYRVRVVARGSNTPLDLNDLSSGERTILRTVLWFYNTKHNNIFPKLFFLDEPDAYLHPSMTRQFIDVLKTVLVGQYSVRVILTTHSPSTVALAPEESLFVMSREQPRIRRPASKAEAIGLLTSGLVIVSPGTRFVLVEDEEDLKFYSAIRDVLADQGPSKDPKALKPAPSLVFMPASTGKGSGKTGGGKSAVTQWVEKLNAAPLNEMFHGIIDLDEGNTSGPRIHVLSRYSIENYQLDPIIVLGVLIEEKKAPSLPNVAVTLGDEHQLRTLPASALQSVVDYVAQQVETALGTLTSSEKALTTVTFTNGIELNYPGWMVAKRGHDLFSIYQKVFGQPVITPPKLERSFRRARLVPMELAEIMSRLQQR